MLKTIHTRFLPVLFLGLLASGCQAAPPQSLQFDAFQPVVEAFNVADEELVKTTIPNAQAATWLSKNIPLFECPDKEIEQTYYFRWWTYRKHVRQTPDGFIVTEFLPDVPWAGKYNSISAPAAHHFAEGRWLREDAFLNDYAKFWLRGGGNPRLYSFPIADALWRRYLVNGQREPMVSLLPDLVDNYRAWEDKHRDPNGLYWQSDDRDGMEMSVGGSGYRPTLGAYQYADARAIAGIARLAGNTKLAQEFDSKAVALRALYLETLWNAEDGFFETVARNADGTRAATSGVREQVGFVPWLYGMPEAKHLAAWKQLTDKEGFAAPFGPTTVEQRDPGFKLVYQGHETQWNGPSWPFATSQTLTALANVLNENADAPLSKADYFRVLRGYALSHRRTLDNGKKVFWIDENLHPQTGDWISRTRLKTWSNGTWDAGKGGRERGKDYNHSTFNDLVISGLMGVRPRADNTLQVNPLLPDDWDYAALDNLSYHGQNVGVYWDKAGTRYGRGAGLTLVVNGQTVAQSPTLARLSATIPAPAQNADLAIKEPARETVNLGRGAKVSASFTSQYDKLEQINDGIESYSDAPRSRWSAYDSPNASDWVQFDFDEPRQITGVKLDVFADTEQIRAPQKIRVQWWDGAWKEVRFVEGDPNRVNARANVFQIEPVETDKIRVTLTHAPGFFSGLSEVEVRGARPDGALNLAREAKVSASFTSQYDKLAQINDGVISYGDAPRSRWSNYASPNSSDWIELRFGAAKTVESVKLYVFTDTEKAKTPRSFRVQIWQDDAWQNAQLQNAPTTLKQGENNLKLAPTSTERLKIELTAQNDAIVALSEVEVTGR